MIIEALFALVVFQSIFDQREYHVPFVLPLTMFGFLLGSMLDPIGTIAAALIVLWALGVGPFWAILGALANPLAFSLIPLAYKVRRRQMGMSDLLIPASIGCLLGWSATLSIVAGMEAWRLFQKNRTPNRFVIPMVPGVALGFALWITITRLGLGGGV